ncbi:phosphotransferase [Legionella jordanis]|uniref:Homoserine kinase n=1 Tax=Legionella jordanis TaxID=456 RepID=A0A0W0VAQ1_9GAMM|nr:phosphotransferase [Legionella jordanis]KTD16934.1 homoserine kinase [Legionella jordanis]RMX00286.1 aminoglycoside phosphotransferase family protein [Legionella jordanis]VEH13632.1 homoserine kinase [Legionella jordanis]
MENLISHYSFKFNLHNAIFTHIEHKDAMVAVVYKVVLPDGSRSILKICPRDEDYHREVYFLQFFSKLIRVPKIIKIEPPFKGIYGGILMEYLPGSVLTHNELTENLAFEIGAMLACIHLNRTSSYGDLTQPYHLTCDPKTPLRIKFKEGLSECRGHLSQGIIDQIQGYYDSHENIINYVDGPCIIHRDFRPGNILVKNKKLLGIIDWASARSSFAEEDFCALELNEWSSNSKIKASFLDGYASIRPIPNYTQLMPLLLMARSIAIIGYTIKKGTWNSMDSLIHNKNLEYIKKLLVTSDGQ